MGCPKIDFPRDEAAWPSARRFLWATRLWWICIALRGQDQNGSAFGKPKLFVFDSDASSAKLFGTLLAAVICSTVFSIGIPRGFFAALESIELGGIQPALFAAEYLSGMNGRKRTIARLP